jgi:hypothetical protein
LGTHLTGGSHLSARGRERGEEAGALAGCCGPKAAGRRWKRKKERREERMGWASVAGLGLLFFFFFFFLLFFFKSIFKPISNLFKFKSFSCFQIQILTQISSTILKDFHKPFLITFQTFF